MLRAYILAIRNSQANLFISVVDTQIDNVISTSNFGPDTCKYQGHTYGLYNSTDELQSNFRSYQGEFSPCKSNLVSESSENVP